MLFKSLKEKMKISLSVAIALFGTSAFASAEDIVVTAHVQRVVLLPSGVENCPPPCPVEAKVNPDGSRFVCVSNAGGCQTMEVKIDHVYRGPTGAITRQFSTRIGEFGATFPATNQQIVVSQEGDNVRWSYAIEQNGKIYIDPKQLRSVAGVATGAKGGDELVSLDEVWHAAAVANQCANGRGRPHPVGTPSVLSSAAKPDILSGIGREYVQSRHDRFERHRKVQAVLRRLAGHAGSR
jgi:hypothetical protein